MTAVFWTARAQADLAAIHAFVEADSPHFASVVVRRLLKAVERLHEFPHSGRSVPEYSDASVREVILPPYRIVYRIVDLETIHVLTVHHAARGDPWNALSHRSTLHTVAMPHKLPEPVAEDLRELLTALASLGYEPVESRYTPESFGDYIVDLVSADGRLQIVRERLQYYLGDSGEAQEVDRLKRLGMFRAFDDRQAFSAAVLSFIHSNE